MKEKEKIISKTENMGSIEVPIKRAENTLIFRIHLGSATESDGAIWEISHSGGSLVVTVPKRENIPCYIISFEDIIREVMKKEESRRRLMARPARAGFATGLSPGVCQKTLEMKITSS